VLAAAAGLLLLLLLLLLVSREPVALLQALWSLLLLLLVTLQQLHFLPPLHWPQCKPAPPASFDIHRNLRIILCRNYT
jgi:hypothetical protein